MIFTNSSGGRTGNQLVIMSHLFASSLEHHIPFFNFGPNPNKYFYIKNTWRQLSYNIPLLVKIYGKLTSIKFSRSILAKLGFPLVRDDLAAPNAQVPIIRRAGELHQHVLLMVWPYTDYDAIFKHQNECRDYLIPRQRYRDSAEAVLSELRKTSSTLVGVHVRRTDYKTWFRGKYYYDFSVYERAMLDMLKLCPDGVQFIICSDEKLSPEDFSSIPSEHLYFSHNEFVTDFVLLASCDYILGPPSTFSGYASFYGQAKKCTLFSSEQVIKSLDEFGVVMIDYDDITEFITEDGDVHREYVRLSEGRVLSRYVPTLESEDKVPLRNCGFKGAVVNREQ